MTVHRPPLASVFRATLAGIVSLTPERAVGRIAVIAGFLIAALAVSATAAPRERTGGFEGVYAVGTTECVVVPEQGSFVVRWSGVQGREYYLYDPARSVDGKVAFSTDPSDGSPVKTFIFDSNQITSGTFVIQNTSPNTKGAGGLPVRKIADLPGQMP